MGLTGVLGRNVFSKSRSSCGAGHEHHNVRGRRWSSVRSYLCGDELFDSVLAEEDSASVKTFQSGKSSEATVTQPVFNELTVAHEALKVDEIESPSQDQSLHTHEEEQAAIRIQSAFRCYMARRVSAQAEMTELSCNVEDLSRSGESESVCTSLEVQTAHSVKILSVSQRAKTQLKFKEDWDDSTVSSNISKMRMQNRLEAMTRCERALAYAFSQQLRICSKKRAGKSEQEESDMGWSWLERWMATRIPDKDDFHSNKQPQDTVIITNAHKPISPAKIKSYELAKEEKESCGSNEVFLQLNSSLSMDSRLSAAHDSKSLKTNQSKLKPRRSVSKRKTVPSYQFAKE
uniref:Protein IQ-DOMAIN 1 n=1 Tax=Kalanchoe fedtschenkoi TaxID=63787 RepID=A0A7N0ZSM8_KALFE